MPDLPPMSVDVFRYHKDIEDLEGGVRLMSGDFQTEKRGPRVDRSSLFKLRGDERRA